MPSTNNQFGAKFTTFNISFCKFIFRHIPIKLLFSFHIAFLIDVKYSYIDLCFDIKFSLKT